MILYMTTLPLAEVRANLSKLVEEAERTHQRVEVTKNGRRAAVLMSADDYDSLMETMDILSDAQAMAALREADADIAAGRVYPAEVVEAQLRTQGIIP
jgi:prevent-host-death family protein